MDNLHYQGDCSDIDQTRLLGPDLHGAFYVAVAARYSEATDTTTVAVKPVPPAQLEGFMDARHAEVAKRARIRRLFVGDRSGI